MMIVSAADIRSILGDDGTRHITDSGFPVVLPSTLGPEQTLISNFEYHLFNINNVDISG